MTTDNKETVLPASEVNTKALGRSERRRLNRLDNRDQRKYEYKSRSAQSDNFFKRAITFFKESKEELGRVVWPTKKETIDSTWRLMILVIIAGLYLGIVDAILNKLMGLIA